MVLIDNTEDLSALCAALAHERYITVDTEFMRETTYWPHLCLIQVAGASVNGLIDPLAAGIDLAPFFALMQNTAVLKVFHAARQDIEIMVHLSGAVPQPIFDTQIAAMVCGFGDQVSYEVIVRKLARAQIDKSSRFTDWSHRPLNEKQLAYALSDVTYLRPVYEALCEELQRSGRAAWLEDDMAQLAQLDTYILDPQQSWRRIKLRLKSKKQLAILIAVAALREREAREKNIPRGRLLKDDAIGEIVIQAPQSVKALSQLRALPKGQATSKLGELILKAVAEGLAQDPQLLPAIDLDNHDTSTTTQAAIEILRLAQKIICEQEGIAPKLLATTDDLENLVEAKSPDNPLLQGWRYAVFGRVADDILQGKASISFQKGRAVIAPLTS